MRARFFLAPIVLILGAPSVAGGLDFFEGTHGSPGITASLPSGPTAADVDLDADSGEGGGLAQGATEIELRPTGSLVFLDFVCELPGCAENVDYHFTPGDAASGGRVIVSDSGYTQQYGRRDIGQLSIDGEGGVDLVDCHYIGADGVERSCDPFTIATLPEPGLAAGLALGAGLLCALRRRVRAL